MARTRRYPRTFLVVAVALGAAALLWRAVAVPALVKYPTDVDATPRYAGTFTLYVDPATAAPLATPTQAPLTVERHIQAIGDESGSSKVVVRETITQQAGSLLSATQTNQYVMDRSTLQNVADPRAYAFTPDNVVDRSGAYRLNLPFDTSASGAYRIYKNELGTTYDMRSDTANPRSTVEGLSVDGFTASVTDVPLSAAYLTELDKVVPLPRTLTLDQLKPQLRQAGLDVDALLVALQPQLTAADLATLAQVATQPIALQYVMSFDGTASVEPTTGAEVVVGNTESIGARPVLAGVDQLQTVLSHYPAVPAASAASTALSKLATAPATKLFEYSFQQTPESIADIAGQVKDNKRSIDLARTTVPFGLAAIAAAALAAGGVVAYRRRSTPRPEIDLREKAPPTPPAVTATTAGSAR